MDQDPIIRTIARLSVSPGDTVVLHAGPLLTAQQIDALYNRLHRSLPEGVKALVLDGRLNPLQVIALKPSQADERFDWADFRAMADEPAVDTAIRALLENQDEDNAVCMVRAVVEAAGERLERLAAGHVKMPTGADEAAAMANLGIAWLTEHAPERLKQSQPGSVLAAARSAIKARDTYGWSVEADAALNGLRAVLAQTPQPEAQAAVTDAALVEVGRLWVQSVGTGNGPDFGGMRKILQAAPQPVALPQWQPIETAPKDGTHILVWTHASVTTYVVCWADAAKGIRKYLTAESGAERGWHLAWDGTLFDREHEPTHWMPLPAAPSAQAAPAQSIAKLIEPLREVLRISDRQHVAWDAAKAALAALEAELAQHQGSAT